MISRRDLGLLWAGPAFGKVTGFEQVAGALPPREKRKVVVERLGEAFVEPGFRRQKIRYGAKPGSPVYAWLLTPEKFTGRAALCLHHHLYDIRIVLLSYELR